MVSFGQSKQAGDATYRKGLVLGFTLAEVMLLVVFCLLLISGAIIKKKEESIAKIDNSDPSMVVLRVPREKIVYDQNKPMPDSTGTIVSLWPILGDVDKSKIVQALNEKGLLDPTEETLTKLEIVRTLSNTELKDLIEQKAAKDSERQKIPENVLAKLENLQKNGTDWKTISEALTPAIMSGHRWPPLIPLNETNGYRFASGSAEITPEFRLKIINEAIPQIVAYLREYSADIVEVIGHTDSVPVRQDNKSNLDKTLGPYIGSNLPADEVIVADNAGLGLARAAAVIQILMSDPRLRDAHFVALSAGQLLKLNGELTLDSIPVDDPQRRRLVVRIRCSHDPCSTS